jgi:hypothetical protein
MIRNILASMAVLGTAVVGAGVQAGPASTPTCFPPATSEVGNDFDGDGFGDLLVTVGQEGVDGMNNAGAIHAIYGSVDGLTADGNQFWTLNSPGMAGDGAEPDDRFGRAATTSDFDNDGHTDVAVGVDGEDGGGVTDAGAVHVIYGSPGGLQTGDLGTDDQIWTQGSAGMAGDGAESGDQWGATLGAGDFNGDGFGDLVVGAEHEWIGSIRDAGGVNVLMGSLTGLTTLDSKFIRQGASGILDSAEPGDSFGWGLATGDFDNDGCDDLAVGAQFEDIEETPTLRNAGAVHVIFGSETGLTNVDDLFWTQDIVGGIAAEDEWFGRRLGVGDFDGNGWDDLAISAAKEDADGVLDAGAANVAYFGADGLLRGEEWTQNSAECDGSEEFDEFGFYPQGIGDFNGDGDDDLGISDHHEDVSGLTDAGAVCVMYGSDTGLAAGGSQFWTQNSAGMKGNGAGQGDRFGRVSRAHDFDGDGFFDLVIGAGEEDVGSIEGAGAVHVLYGTASGLTAARNQFWTQDSPEIEDDAELGDNFGRWMPD